MDDISNGVLYGLFTFSALLGGTMINTFGPRITMMFGVTGYPIYIGGLWYFDSYGKLWFPVLAGAYLGITAGCLWSVAGTIILSLGRPTITDNFKASWATPTQRSLKKGLGERSNGPAMPPVLQSAGSLPLV
jgi:MFS family permease